MSRWATLIAPVAVMAIGRDIAGTLPVGTAIKGVRIDGDAYTFAALWFGEWTKVRTCADLPAATDRGAAYRAKRARGATLRPGRPAVSSTAATVRLVCKVTPAQAEAVERIAAEEKTNTPGLIRKALKERGMPE